MENTMTASQPPQNQDLNFRFKGEILPLSLIMLKNFLLTMVTVGIYYFWGKTHLRKYLWRHTDFSGDRFRYTGEGLELFRGFLKIFAGYIVLFLIVAGTTYISPAFGVFFQMIFGLAVSLITPFAIYMSRNYKLTRTQWRGIQFGMTRSGLKEYITQFMIGGFFTIITLGLYTPWYQHRLHKTITENTMVGHQRLKYTGKASDLILDYVLLIILVPFTAGLYLPFFAAKLMRYRAQHTYLNTAHKQLEIKGWELLGLLILNFILIGVTFGLGAPLVLFITFSYFLSRTSFQGKIDFDEIQKGQHLKSSGFGDALGDALDLDIGI